MGLYNLPRLKLAPAELAFAYDGLRAVRIESKGTSLDQFAVSQLIITLQAPNDSAFLNLLTQNSDRIIETFEELERQRLTSANSQNPDQKLISLIREKHGIILALPTGYEIALDTTNCTWLIKESNTIIQGILIYHVPYTQTGNLTLEKLVSQRDTVLKQYIHGTVAGSYMTTEMAFQPTISTYRLRSLFSVSELRGLWRMENGISMGGPFISVSRFDDPGQQITTVEGFVYAAGFEKRNYIRELEAIVISLE